MMLPDCSPTLGASMKLKLYLISAALLVASSICVDINLEDKPKSQDEEGRRIF